MNAIDGVTAADPVELATAGLDQWPYTGSGRPSQAWFDACRARGIDPRVMVQETYSRRSMEGHMAGQIDCAFAEARARAVGHTGAIAVVVSDGNGRDAWDASQYGAGWASVATMPFFPYGALGVTESFLWGAACPLLIEGEWVPETWGQGRLASQLVGAQAPISTPHDLNTVHVDVGPKPPLPPGPEIPPIGELMFVIRNNTTGVLSFGSELGAHVTSRALAGGSVPAGMAVVQLDDDEIGPFLDGLKPVAGNTGAAVPLHVELTGTATP